PRRGRLAGASQYAGLREGRLGAEHPGHARGGRRPVPPSRRAPGPVRRAEAVRRVPLRPRVWSPAGHDSLCRGEPPRSGTRRQGAPAALRDGRGERLPPRQGQGEGSRAGARGGTGVRSGPRRRGTGAGGDARAGARNRRSDTGGGPAGPAARGRRECTGAGCACAASAARGRCPAAGCSAACRRSAAATLSGGAWSHLMGRWAIINAVLAVIVALLAVEIAGTWSSALPPVEVAPGPRAPAAAPEKHEKGKRGAEKSGAHADEAPATLVAAIADKDLFDISRQKTTEEVKALEQTPAGTGPPANVTRC